MGDPQGARVAVLCAGSPCTRRNCFDVKDDVPSVEATALMCPKLSRRRELQVNSRTHGLNFSMYQSGIDFKCPIQTVR
jgi:hypothetical protein